MGCFIYKNYSTFIQDLYTTQKFENTAMESLKVLYEQNKIYIHFYKNIANLIFFTLQRYSMLTGLRDNARAECFRGQSTENARPTEKHVSRYRIAIYH